MKLDHDQSVAYRLQMAHSALCCSVDEELTMQASKDLRKVRGVILELKQRYDPDHSFDPTKHCELAKVQR